MKRLNFEEFSFIPFDITTWLIQLAISITGVAYAFVMVSTFVRARLEVLYQGYADSIETNLVISSFWSASFYLGNFLGPTIGGVFVDYFGFRPTTFTFFIVYLIMTMLDLGIGMISARSN